MYCFIPVEAELPNPRHLGRVLDPRDFEAVGAAHDLFQVCSENYVELSDSTVPGGALQAEHQRIGIPFGKGVPIA